MVKNKPEESNILLKKLQYSQTSFISDLRRRSGNTRQTLKDEREGEGGKEKWKDNEIDRDR